MLMQSEASGICGPRFKLFPAKLTCERRNKGEKKGKGELRERGEVHD